MLRNEILCERETEPAAAFAPGDERIEDALEQRFRYAGAVVDDAHFDRVAVALARERHLARDSRAQPDLAFAADETAALIACAALRAMLSVAWMSCSRSPSNVGRLVS